MCPFFKKHIELLVGYEVEDIEHDPIMDDNGNITGWDIRVTPKKTLQSLNMNIKIIPTGSIEQDKNE